MKAGRFVYEQDENGCWIWQGPMDRNGYGRVYHPDRKQTEWAHRYSHEIHKGAIPSGHEVDHVCQVTRCVNPDHLDAVTKREHVRRTMQRLGKDELHLAAAHLRKMGATYADIAAALDYSDRASAAAAVNAAIEKGLISPDEVPAVRFLSEVERQEIVDLVAVGIPQTVVAQIYGVDSSQISRVSRGITSGHGRRTA